VSALLSPIGYVIQDAVADAMTVEAVPRVDEHGRPIAPATRKLMHTTMQTLGRMAIIGGSTLVALINLYLFTGVEKLPQAEIALIYRDVYLGPDHHPRDLGAGRCQHLAPQGERPARPAARGQESRRGAGADPGER
jgi:hypothetical protein